MRDRLLAPALCLALASCAAAAAGPIAEAPLAEEVARLERLAGEVEGAGLPEMFAGLSARHREALARAREASVPALVVHRLHEPFVGLETLAFVARHSAAGGGLPAFEALWASRAEPFASRTADFAGPPLLVAMQQAAENRAGRLYRAARPYAAASDPGGGLYYLGEAASELAWRDFLARLAAAAPAGGPPGRPLDERRLAEALAAGEREATERFAADPTAPGLVVVSARLKEARELLDDGRREAAALLLLEARLLLARSAPAPAAAPAAVLPDDDGGGLLAPFLASARAGGDEVVAAAVADDLVPLFDRLTRSDAP